MRRPFATLLLALPLLACESSTRAPAVAPCAPARVAPPPPPPPAAPPPAPVAFDPAPWLEDLDALVAALASHYANLDHAVDVRKMDLAVLVKRGRDRIVASQTRTQAERAIRGFLRSFGDGHLDVDWEDGPAPAPPPTSARPTGLCKRLGYTARDPGGVDFTKVAGFTPAADADAIDLGGGVLRMSGGRVLGVVRIAAFIETDHIGLCENARLNLGLADDATCSGDCEHKLALAVDDLLTAALERRVAALAKAGAQVLAVDLTSNGGGDDWIDPVLRVISPIPVPLKPIGAVRHEHWRTQVEWSLGVAEKERAAHGDLQGGALDRAITGLRAALAEVSTPCDKTPLFRPGGAAPACTQLVHVPPILAYARPGELQGRDAEGLFWPSRYRYHESVNHLPIAVLVDEWTASAAEDFAERVQDLGIGRIVGATTLGSGCGFTNGGIPTTLPRSGGKVRMSDCARFRADGSNAVAGVTPDVPLPLLERDSLTQRAQKIAAGLDASWKQLLHPKVAATLPHKP